MKLESIVTEFAGHRNAHAHDTYGGERMNIVRLLTAQWRRSSYGLNEREKEDHIRLPIAAQNDSSLGFCWDQRKDYTRDAMK